MKNKVTVEFQKSARESVADTFLLPSVELTTLFTECQIDPKGDHRLDVGSETKVERILAIMGGADLEIEAARKEIQRRLCQYIAIVASNPSLDSGGVTLVRRRRMSRRSERDLELLFNASSYIKPTFFKRLTSRLASELLAWAELATEMFFALALSASMGKTL